MKHEIIIQELENERGRYNSLFVDYNHLVGKSEERLDLFLDQMRVKEEVKAPNSTDFKPLKRIKEPWSKVAARMEAKHKEEYWKQKTESLESDVAALEKKIVSRET